MNARRKPISEGSEPERTDQANKPKRRRRLRWIIAALVVLLAYPVLGTLALWSGMVEALLKSEDMRVEIANPAWTVWPGKVHIRGLRLLINGETQFILSADELVANIELLPFFERRFKVVQLEANNVRYRMRVQMADTKGMEERLAAYPPLEDLPGDPTASEKQAEKTEERGPSWTVDVGGIDASISELWFMEYHYVGDGRLRGGFLRGPQVMAVQTAVQDLGPGELHFGADQIIAKKFRGRVAAEIPELNPSDHADESFLEFVTASIQLKGDIQTLKHVGAYLDGIQVKDGAGPLDIDFSLERGYLAEKSYFRFRAEELTLSGAGFGVKTDWQFAIDVLKPEQRERPRIISKARSTYVSFAKPGADPFTVQLHKHEQRVTLSSSQLGGATEIQDASLRFPRIVTEDIDDLDGLSKKGGTALQTEGGSARGSLRLDLDENQVLRGPFEARLSDVKLVVAGVRVGSSGRVKSLIELDPKAETTVLRDVSIALSDAEMHVGDEHVENWWMRMSIPRFKSWGFPPEHLEAKLEIRAKDAEPIIEALAEKDKAPDLVAKFTSFDDLTVDAVVHKRGDVLDVMLGTFESDVWDIAGRYHKNGEQSRSAFLIGGETIAVGVAVDSSGTEIEPLVGEDWLNAKLRHFPEPIKQVRGEKP